MSHLFQVFHEVWPSWFVITEMAMVLAVSQRIFQALLQFGTLLSTSWVCRLGSAAKNRKLIIAVSFNIVDVHFILHRARRSPEIHNKQESNANYDDLRRVVNYNGVLARRMVPMLVNIGLEITISTTKWHVSLSRVEGFLMPLELVEWVSSL